MSHRHSELLRLLRLAQAGQPEEALTQAREHLDQGETLGILYVQAVALHCLGNHKAAADAAARMLDRAATAGITAEATIGTSTIGTASVGTATVGTATIGTAIDSGAAGDVQTAGWRSIALSFRAIQHMLVNESNPEAFDLETSLQDLAQAEVLLSNDVSDAFVLAQAHTNLAHGYQELRLYELALPHYEAASEVSLAHTGEVPPLTAVTSQLNLTTLHLNWSGELHRIRESDRAREKNARAAQHAALAGEYARAQDAAPYAASASLLAACADSTGDPEDVVVRIRQGLEAVQGQGFRESRAFALPFLAWALERAGRLPEALEIATEACEALTENAKWLLTSAAYHTRAALLARSGSESASAGLAYGDELAKTMWRERLRTLYTARSGQILERVTLERDRVAVLAFTDALTGVGNRRAFDVRVAELSRSTGGETDVAMIVVDVDRLKAVNDAGGHEAGDRALQAVANALTGQVRAGDLVARLGGDEFVAVVEGVDRGDAAEIAERMVEAVSGRLGSQVTVSVGIATGPASEDGVGLLHAADLAMYAAKEASRASKSDAEAQAAHSVRA